MKRVLLLASAALAAGLAATPASAQSNLTVNGVVVPFCNINLTNVSSGTASVAMSGTQQVANLRLACNGTRTRLVMTVQNGDLLSAANNRINYGVELRSPQDNAFTILEHDTNPVGGENNLFFTRERTGYSQAVATGIPLELHMNLNVAPGEPQANGSGNFPANAAPAGTYTEVFSFTATSV